MVKICKMLICYSVLYARRQVGSQYNMFHLELSVVS